jgi:hypothetical protein
MLRANASDLTRSVRLCAGAGSIEFVEGAGAAEGQPAKLPTFRMKLYSGAPMTVGYYGRVILDVEGMEIPGQPIPVHRDHDFGKIVGHGTGSKQTGTVYVDGVLSGANAHTQEVRDSAKNGFPWQASIEAEPLRVEEVRPGAEAKVNGRSVSGPIAVFRKSRLKGASFVSLGADPSTKVSVAASHKEKTMTFKEWLVAKGFSPEALTEDQTKLLQATYDAEQAAAKKTTPAGDGQPAEPVAAGAEPVKAVSAADEIKAERQRIAAIEGACKGDWSVEDKAKVEAIRANGIAAGQAIAEVNAELLKVLRASRPAAGAPAFIRGGSGSPVTARLLVAALCMANHAKVGMDDKALVAEFGEQTVEGARKLSRIRLTEIIAAAAEMEGVSLPRFGRGSDEWIRAGFSTVSLPGILSDVANKTLLQAYNAVPSAARRICRIGQLSDFKTHTRYRLTGNMVFEKVAGDGELKHGTLGEDAYHIKGDTFGKFFAITRQDVKNDDLGAFLDIPRMMGRGSALSIEELVFTLLLANPGAFFGVGNRNIYAAAAAALSDASLTVMIALLRNQTDANGKPINITPAILLVPPALKDLADRLYVSRNNVAGGVVVVGAPVMVSSDNIHVGKYQPVDSPYLSNTGFHANASAVDWYLFANPADLAAFELAFVDGVETPTIESVGVAPDTLGLGFRGYHDVGVADMDPRAAAKADVG